jgi:hypothetical protein
MEISLQKKKGSLLCLLCGYDSEGEMSTSQKSVGAFDMSLLYLCALAAAETAFSVTHVRKIDCLGNFTRS